MKNTDNNHATDSSELEAAIKREKEQQANDKSQRPFFEDGSLDPCAATAQDFKIAITRGLFRGLGDLQSVLNRAIFFAIEDVKRIEKEPDILSEVDSIYLRLTGRRRANFRLLKSKKRSIDLESLRDEIVTDQPKFQKLCAPSESPTLPIGQTEVNPELMDVQAAATYLGYSKKQMYNFTSQHLIRFSRPRGKLFFSKQDLDDFVRHGNRAPNYEMAEEAEKILLNTQKTSKRAVKKKP